MNEMQLALIRAHGYADPHAEKQGTIWVAVATKPSPNGGTWQSAASGRDEKDAYRRLVQVITRP